jgi:hypothetical protein
MKAPCGTLDRRPAGGPIGSRQRPDSAFSQARKPCGCADCFKSVSAWDTSFFQVLRAVRHSRMVPGGRASRPPNSRTRQTLPQTCALLARSCHKNERCICAISHAGRRLRRAIGSCCSSRRLALAGTLDNTEVPHATGLPRCSQLTFVNERFTIGSICAARRTMIYNRYPIPYGPFPNFRRTRIEQHAAQVRRADELH